MADLFSDLTSKPQRETAGSDTSSRFDYQKDWAFCRMLRKHIEDESYLVAFEYHDDVLFLTPAENPDRAEFVQVKTSKSSTPKALGSFTKKPGGKASILAKMFANFDGICSSHDVQVTLVSNVPFSFAPDNACATDLDEKVREKITEKLKEEIPNFNASLMEKLYFHVTGISLEKMQSFLQGEAMELFVHKFGEDHGLNISTWIRLIKTEIARKNNFPSDDINATNELIDKKCIGKSFVDETLDEVWNKTKQSVDVGTVSSILQSAGWKTAEVLKIGKRIPEAQSDFVDPLNDEVRALVNLIRGYVFDDNGELLELTKILEKTKDEAKNRAEIHDIYKRSDYLCALGIVVYYDEL